ncbi:MAG: DUF1146 domain-containing protein [Candidatus Coprovivens sp.]
MNYKLFIYIISLFASIFALSGINFDGFIKTNKAIEARVLVILLSLALSYLVTGFITDFSIVSSIIKG